MQWRNEIVGLPGGLPMFMRQFFEVLGLSIRDTQDLWPDDRATRLQEKSTRLRMRLQRGYPAMVRCRRRIEELRQRAERQRLEPVPAADVANARLMRLEARYARILDRVTRLKQKQARIQNRLRELQLASI